MPAPSTMRPNVAVRIAVTVGAVLAGLTAGGGRAAATTTPTTAPLSYSLLATSGQVVGLDGAFSAAAPWTSSGYATPSPPVAVADTADGLGAFVASANGAVTALGDAQPAGSLTRYHLASSVVGITADAANGGYWMVVASGGVFAFGGAPFFGSEGGSALPGPVVGMAATPDDGGYWLVTSTGAVYPFGDAHNFGSMAGIHLGTPVVGMAPSTDGAGYWLVAAGGGVFAFGDAGFHGSAAILHLPAPVVAIAASPGGNGYWLASAQGGIFSYGDATFMGSAAPMKERFVSFSTGPAVNTVVPIQPADAYQNPFRAVRLTPMRIDEGVDYGGNGPVYAVGDGVVESTTGAWPGGAFITYRLVNGPAAGKLVYLAENVTPTVAIGQSVTPNTVIGTMHNAYPYIETGWAADPYGDTMAAASGTWTSADDAQSLPTAYGVNFNQMLVWLGAISGIEMHPTVVGTLAPGWPTW